MEVIGYAGLTASGTENGINGRAKNVPRKSRVIVRSYGRIQGATEGGSKREQLRIFKSIFEGAVTSHGKASYAARPPVFNCAKARIHIRDQFANKVRLILVCGRTSAVGIPAIVSLRRDDNHVIVRCV